MAAAALCLASCQSPAGHGAQPPPTSLSTAPTLGPSMTSNSTSNPPPGNAPPTPAATSLEVTYSKRCPDMAQARSVRISSARLSLSLVDEAGEARMVKLTADRIATLAAALKKAGLDRLTSAPGVSKEPCTFTLHAVIDGAAKDVEESKGVAVNDAAAWKAVQKLIEDFAYGG